MKKLIFAILFATATISCSKSDENAIIQPQNIIPIEVLKGNLYGNGAENILEQRTVISNLTDWNVLIAQMGSVNPIQNIPTINFATEKAIIIFDKIRGSGGNSIDVTNIIENTNNINITIQRLQTGGLTAVMTQPYHIVKISQTSKPIVFN